MKWVIALFLRGIACATFMAGVLEHDAINAHKTERRIFACRSYALCFRAFKPEFEQISNVDGKVSCPRIYLLRRRFLLVFP